MVECLNCGKRRELPSMSAPGARYVGWAIVEELDEATCAVRLERAGSLVPERRIRVAS